MASAAATTLTPSCRWSRRAATPPLRCSCRYRRHCSGLRHKPRSSCWRGSNLEATDRSDAQHDVTARRRISADL